MARRLALTVQATSAFVLALGLVGCDSPGMTSKASKTPASVAQQPVGRTTTTSAGVGHPSGNGGQSPAVWTPNLTISDAIARACGIAPNTEAQSVSPSFDFDSAALGEADREMLAQVAKCLTEGALRGRSVRLVGRADPRGEQEYNMTLGDSRANSVVRYFLDLGVGRPRLQPTSRGELDAVGTDEASWARDRRVDIELVP